MSVNLDLTTFPTGNPHADYGDPTIGQGGTILGNPVTLQLANGNTAVIWVHWAAEPPYYQGGPGPANAYNDMHVYAKIYNIDGEPITGNIAVSALNSNDIRNGGAVEDDYALSIYRQRIGDVEAHATEDGFVVYWSGTGRPGLDYEGGEKLNAGDYNVFSLNSQKISLDGDRVGDTTEVAVDPWTVGASDAPRVLIQDFDLFLNADGTTTIFGETANYTSAGYKQVVRIDADANGAPIGDAEAIFDTATDTLDGATYFYTTGDTHTYILPNGDQVLLFGATNMEGQNHNDAYYQYLIKADGTKVGPVELSDYGQITFGNTGNGWLAQRSVSSSELFPEADGGYTIAWQAYTSDGYTAKVEVFTQRFDADGNPLYQDGTPVPEGTDITDSYVRLHLNAQPLYTFPNGIAHAEDSIIVRDEDGNYTLIYERHNPFRDYQTTNIYFQKVDATGTVIIPETLVGTMPARSIPGNYVDGHLGYFVDEFGNFHIAMGTLTNTTTSNFAEGVFIRIDADGNPIPPGTTRAGLNYIVEGTGGDDLIDGSYMGDPEGDMVDSGDNLAGNDDDYIQAGAGNDTVRSGAGDDVVDAGTGDDQVFGGDGNDSVLGGSGNDYLDGGSGSDTLEGGTGADTLLGGGGDDLLLVEAGDSAEGGDGDDVFIVSDTLGDDGDITIVGGEGGEDLTDPTNGGNGDVLNLQGLENIRINYNQDDPTWNGTTSESGTVTYTNANGNDVTINFSEIERIIAGPADGIVDGTGGDDLIDEFYTGDLHGDLVDSGDAIAGVITTKTPGSNEDYIRAGDGNDTVLAGDGDDLVEAGSGNDSVEGGAGNDTLHGDLGVPVPSGPNLLKNGSFEDGGVVDTGFSVDTAEMSHWTGTGGWTMAFDDNGQEGYQVADASDGSRFVGIVTGSSSVFSFSQTLDTPMVSGSTYELLLDAKLASDGSGSWFENSTNQVPVRLQVLDANNQVVGEVTVTNSSPTVDAPWETYRISITPTSDISEFKIGMLRDASSGQAAVVMDNLVLRELTAPAADNAGDDTLDGGEGDDLIYGGGGDDSLIGAAGRDTLDGGSGDDTLVVGGGDVAQGGDGDDTFRVNPLLTETGNITIVGGEGGEDGRGDVLDIRGLKNAVITYTNNDPTTESGQVTFENSNGQTVIIEFSEIETVICFSAGVQIITIEGEVPVENLAIGDQVLTMDAGYQRIRWIGSKHLDTDALMANPNLRPIRIKAGSLGSGQPSRDLIVSPQHRVLMRSKIAERMFGSHEVLMPAKALLAHPGVEIAEDVSEVTYWHFLFDAHQIVFANGQPTESLFTGPEALKAVSAAAKAEIITLFPELEHMAADEIVSVRPLVKARTARKFVERSQANGRGIYEKDGLISQFA